MTAPDHFAKNGLNSTSFAGGGRPHMNFAHKAPPASPLSMLLTAPPISSHKALPKDARDVHCSPLYDWRMTLTSKLPSEIQTLIENHINGFRVHPSTETRKLGTGWPARDCAGLG
jgi:hypothetical protein